MPYKEIVICPICSHRVPRKVDGTISSHFIVTRNKFISSKFKCSGTGLQSGKIVAAYTLHPPSY